MYSDYLKSKHWMEFRQEILSIRKKCQHCGIKKNLNIHHKHYRTIGKEAGEDIIVLCKECHLRYHKKPKWVRAKRNREEMNFTKTTKPDNELYRYQGIEAMLCNRCNEKHYPFVAKYKYGNILVMACPNSRPRVLAIGKIS